MNEVISLPLEILERALHICSPSSLKVWIGLCLEAHNSESENICIPNTKLKKICDLSHITISKSLAELVRVRLIAIASNKTGSRAGIYTLNAMPSEIIEHEATQYSPELITLDEQALLEALYSPIFKLWQNSLSEIEVRKIYDEERQNHRYLRPSLFEDYFDRIIWEQFLELITETSAREFLHLCELGQLKWDHIKSVLKT